VFDCAIGERAIHYMGHVKMMGAVQPFISGAISKTVNLPESVTVEDIASIYTEGWKLGLKALAIYRDGSKTAQALKTDGGTKTADEAVEAEPGVPLGAGTTAGGEQAARAEAVIVEGRDAEEILPAKLPEPIQYESQRAFVREVLEQEVDLRAQGDGGATRVRDVRDLVRRYGGVTANRNGFGFNDALLAIATKEYSARARGAA
jgi:ribonucleotide reductase alpha subunit